MPNFLVFSITYIYFLSTSTYPQKKRGSLYIYIYYIKIQRISQIHQVEKTGRRVRKVGCRDVGDIFVSGWNY